MIQPTVGRVVWLYGAEGEVHGIRQPFKADVAFVWSPRLINVGYLDHNGTAFKLTSVVLLQDDDLKPADEPFCVWMPYQKGQAAKYEALEAKVGGAA